MDSFAAMHRNVFGLLAAAGLLALAHVEYVAMFVAILAFGTAIYAARLAIRVNREVLSKTERQEIFADKLVGNAQAVGEELERDGP